MVYADMVMWNVLITLPKRLMFWSVKLCLHTSADWVLHCQGIVGCGR